MVTTKFLLLRPQSEKSVVLIKICDRIGFERKRFSGQEIFSRGNRISSPVNRPILNR